MNFLLCPYHILINQVLLPNSMRLMVSEWNLKNIMQNCSPILFTYKTNFSRYDIHNFHNNFLWVEKNSYAITETHFQHQFSVNVWAKIGGNHINSCYVGDLMDSPTCIFFNKNIRYWSKLYPWQQGK